MKERGGERVARGPRRDPLPEGELSVDRAQPLEEKLHHERRSDRVREPSVLGAGKGHRGDPELADAPEALDLPRVEEQIDDALLFRFERDETVHRIAKDHGARSSPCAGPSTSWTRPVKIAPSSP